MHDQGPTAEATETEVPLCPHCFEPVGDFDKVCPDCNYSLTNYVNLINIAPLSMAYLYTSAKRGSIPSAFLLVFAGILLAPLATLLVDAIFERRVWMFQDGFNLLFEVPLALISAYLFYLILRGHLAFNRRTHDDPEA